MVNEVRPALTGTFPEWNAKSALQLRGLLMGATRAAKQGPSNGELSSLAVCSAPSIVSSVRDSRLSGDFPASSTVGIQQGDNSV